MTKDADSNAYVTESETDNNNKKIIIQNDNMNEDEDNNAYIRELETDNNKKRIIKNDNMNEDEDDNAYITESETVNNKKKIIQNDNLILKHSSSFKKNKGLENKNRKNCFQLTTDLTADDDSDSEKISRAQVMLKFGKRGVGHGVIEGYQWDIDRLKTGSYIGSNNVDIIQAYEYNKLPNLKGKDSVLY